MGTNSMFGFLSAPMHFVEWLQELSEAYGYQLLFLLFCSQWLVKGFTMSFVGQPERFIMKAYQGEGSRMQIYLGVAMLPWALNPILGLMSDLFPIAGLNKAPYLIIC